MPAKAPIRVFCVDDHAVLTDCLISRLKLEDDIECVGQLGSADHLIAEARRASADIVLLDIEMPGPDALEVMGELHRQCSGMRTIILSAHTRDGYIERALQKGARGFFSKSDAPSDIIDGIRRVARGEYAFGEGVQERLESLPERRNGEGAVETRLQTLTPREMEVLRMIGRGMSRADIARTLHRSPKTVDAHHTSIMKKLDIHDRVELTRYAIREGLVEV